MQINANKIIELYKNKVSELTEQVIYLQAQNESLQEELASKESGE